ncbi:MAG: hypothetical protein ACOYL6_01990 [Bacteriovoracaceae bacterium]
MKRVMLASILSFLTFFGILSHSQAASTEQITENQVQSWILQSIAEMPNKGGYELTDAPALALEKSFSWEDSLGVLTLELNPNINGPSYCTTATYMVFYKTLQKYWRWTSIIPTKETYSLLKPQMEKDGERLWGRWNANGPGTAKFFYDLKLGTNFEDIKLARAGDFLKIYWNDQVGSKERGHSVIYLGLENLDGIEMIKFWSSNKSTDGYSEKLVPRSDAVRMVFSRLDHIENINNVSQLSVNDDFLSSMLSVESNWEELQRVTGIIPLPSSAD